jgi:hypothetical protein
MTMTTNPRQCTATANGTQERCRKFAMRGQNVCRTPGGAAPQNRRAAARRQAEQAATEFLTRDGSTPSPVYDSLDALSLLAGEILARKDYLRAQVQQLDGELTYAHASGAGIGAAAEDVRAVVAAYERALDRATKVLSILARLDLDERLMRIRGAQADTLFSAIESALIASGYSGQALADIKEAIADNLEAIIIPDDPSEL